MTSACTSGLPILLASSHTSSLAAKAFSRFTSRLAVPRRGWISTSVSNSPLPRATVSSVESSATPFMT